MFSFFTSFWKLPSSENCQHKRTGLLALSTGANATVVHIPIPSSTTIPQSQSAVVLNEKLEWSSMPLTCVSHPCQAPFLVSLLPHAVEVHDVSGATLQPSQHMYFASPISISCSDVSCEDTDGSPVVVVASADTVAILTLIPVAKQVTYLPHSLTHLLLHEAIDLLLNSVPLFLLITDHGIRTKWCI